MARSRYLGKLVELQRACDEAPWRGFIVGTYTEFGSPGYKVLPENGAKEIEIFADTIVGITVIEQKNKNTKLIVVRCGK